MTLSAIETKIDFDEIENKLEDLDFEAKSINEIMPKLRKIQKLKEEKNVLFLAHYYQTPPIQLIADIKGDSLALAMTAKKVGQNYDLILSSTVHFMAEMVKLLNPNKKVVIPDLEASCSIAEGINGSTIRKIKNHFPESAIIGYINTSAEAKAEMDSVCTSANATKVISRIQGKEVILLPDYFFAKNILQDAIRTGEKRSLIAYKGIERGNIILENVASNYIYKINGEKIMLPLLNKGTCIVHEQFTPAQIETYRREHKVDLVMAHPEVNPDVAKLAEMVGGTQKMIDYLKDKNIKKVLILTECDLSAPLREAYPNIDLVTPCFMCPYMKKNTLDKVINALKYEKPEMTLDPILAIRARKSLDKMFELTA